VHCAQKSGLTRRSRHAHPNAMDPVHKRIVSCDGLEVRAGLEDAAADRLIRRTTSGQRCSWAAGSTSVPLPGVATAEHRRAKMSARDNTRSKTETTMAYDEKLAKRVRDLLADETDVSEKRMFGGPAFLIGGNMAVTASHRGGLMIRVDPATADELIAATPATQIEMRGRAMPGWVHVDSDLSTKPQLARWVALATTYTRSLPAKG